MKEFRTPHIFHIVGCLRFQEHLLVPLFAPVAVFEHSYHAHKIDVSPQTKAELGAGILALND